MPHNNRKFGNQRNKSRKVGTRTPRARILVVTGGECTEDEYLKWVERELRGANIDLHVESRGYDPRSLLELAIELRDIDAREAQRKSDSGNTYDETWVVSDVDDFAQILKNVIPQARNARVGLAVSNPCFEVWLLAHVERSAAPLTTDGAQRQARKRMLVDPSKPKHVNIEILRGKFEFAEETAINLRRGHDSAGTKFPRDSPSTNVHVLVRNLINFAAQSNPGHSHGL